MNNIIRGTSPIINVTIPGLSDISVNEVWFSFKNGEETHTYSRSEGGITVLEEEGVVSKAFSQDETLALSAGVMYMQIRILDNTEMAFATPWLSIMVEDIIDDGNMELIDSLISPEDERPEINIEATVTAVYEELLTLQNDIKAIVSVLGHSETVGDANLVINDAVPFRANNVIVEMLPVQEGSGTPSTSNVRNITGRQTASVTVSATGEVDETYLADFGTVVYGGVYDFTTGELTITHNCIDSYQGEPVNEPWLSSKEPYVAGTQPIVGGARVVYPSSFPRKIYIDPQVVKIPAASTTFSYSEKTKGGHLTVVYLPNNT